MDNAAARAWLNDELHVPRETVTKLEAFVDLVTEESRHQNLVSARSLESVWARHILDSAQLLAFSPSIIASWVDLGSGAGFPGIIVGLLHQGPVTLIEERRKRIEFLEKAVELLELNGRVSVLGSRVETAPSMTFEVISARAFAPLDRLLALGQRFAAPQTRWVLPKGRNAHSELEAARALWQGEFRLEPSLTDADAQIIVAEQVRRRSKGKQ